MLVGALHLLCGGNVEDAVQPLVHVTHPVSGGCGQRVQKRSRHGHVLASPGESRMMAPHEADGGSHSLGLSSGGSEVHR